ncbi:unnamed protein product [Parnassius mnemosyne]|uniref:Uncharacterized protein n=1 Tax=Parnassius mnemosyne TaxID=213953 RepID=A0AAV1KGE6_9NEOP
MTGKDKGSTSLVRKSASELESRLVATPKNIIAALPTKHITKIAPANVGDDNQVDKETTKYSNRAQEAKAHLVRICSRNLKTEIKDGIIEAADKLYDMTKNVEQGKGYIIETEKSEVIKEVCESTIPKMKNQNKLTLPWWNDELVLLKKDVTTKKRRIRCAAPVRKDDDVAAKRSDYFLFGCFVF